MRRLPTALLALLVLSAPAIAGAQNPADQAAGSEKDADRAAKALKLAQLVEPRDALVSAELIEAEFVKGMLSNADMKSLEDDYPGAFRAMWRAAASEMIQQTEATLPSYWERLAAIYRKNMSTEEIDAACAFFRSDLGRKLVKLKSQSMVEQIARLAPQSDTGTVTQEMFSAGNTDAAKSAVTALSSNEQLMLAAFGMSAAGQKLQSLAPQVHQVSVEWMNESTPEGDAKIEALMVAGLEAHVEALEADQDDRATTQ